MGQGRHLGRGAGGLNRSALAVRRRAAHRQRLVRQHLPLPLPQLLQHRGQLQARHGGQLRLLAHRLCAGGPQPHVEPRAGVPRRGVCVSRALDAVALPHHAGTPVSPVRDGFLPFHDHHQPLFLGVGIAVRLRCGRGGWRHPLPLQWRLRERPGIPARSGVPDGSRSCCSAGAVRFPPDECPHLLHRCACRARGCCG